ncbi:hypothetical protein BDQ12DRAFT_570208, partial [Crucibulum laeve]
HVMAISSTLYRLYDRKRLHRLWWDDYAALIASFSDCVVFAMMWSSVAEGMRSHSSWQYGLLSELELYPFDSPSWLLSRCPRISLALSISRPVPITWLTVALPCLLAFLGIGVLLQQIIVCGRNTTWYHTPPFVCQFSRLDGSITFACDIIADLALIITPLRMFWGVSLPRLKRRLILCGFSASCFTAITSVICSIFLLSKPQTGGPMGLIDTMMLQLLEVVSLIVCNILVIITSFYRIGRD